MGTRRKHEHWPAKEAISNDMALDVFDQATEPDVFDQASEPDVFDQVAPVSSKGPAESTSPTTASNLSSVALASASKGGLDILSGATRVAQNIPLMKMISGVAKEIGGTTSQEFLTELEGASSRTEDEYGVDPKQKGFLVDLARGAGSILPTLAGGPMAPAANALMMGEQGFQEAEQAGGTTAQKVTSFVGNAAVGAISEKLLGLTALLKSAKAAKIPEKTFKAIVGTVAKQMGLHFGREGFQETGEQIAQDTIAAYISAYDPNRKIFDGKKLLNTFLVGGLVGAAVGGVAQAAVSAPQNVAPKEEMQAQAAQIDQALSDLVTESSKTEQGTPILSPEAIQAVPAGTPEELQSLDVLETQETQTPPKAVSKHSPQVEGESIVSTGIQLPSGEVLTGETWDTRHPTMLMEAIDKGLDDTNYEQNLGFVVQDEAGQQRFASREEALEIARRAGQVDETKLSKNVQGLQSEGLKAPAQTPAQQVYPTEEKSSAQITQDDAAKTLQPFFTQAVEVARKAGAVDPESAVSEAMIGLSKQASEGKTSLNNPGALLSEAARRQALKQVERETAAKRGGGTETVEFEISGASTSVGPRAEAVSREAVSSIEEAVEAMPEADRNVMRAMMDDPTLGIEQLAAQTNLTPDQVKKAKARARETLKQFVRSQGIGERMAPGASNIQELKRAQYIAASDIYEGLRQTNQLDLATFEKNLTREYEDLFTPEEISQVFAVAAEASEQFQASKGRKPFPAIISELLGGPIGEGETSIANKRADAERRKRGLPAAMSAARRSHPVVWDEAMRMMDENAQLSSQTASKFRDDPTLVPNDTETAILLYRQIAAENAYDSAVDDVNTAFDKGNEQDKLEAMQRAREEEAKLIDAYDLNKSAGTAQGRSLASRRMLAGRDYSLARMTAELRAAKGGQELSDKERSDLQSQYENIKRTNAELEERLLKLEEDQARKQAEQVVSDMAKDDPLDPVVKSLVDRILDKLNSAADRARIRLRQKLSYVGALVDPTILTDLIIIGSAKIANGIRRKSQWKKSMIEDLGEEVSPYLDQAFEDSSKELDRVVESIAPKNERVRKVLRDQTSEEVVHTTEEAIKSRLGEGETLNEMRVLVQRLALAFVRGGTTQLDPLVDSVHAVISPLVPVTKRQTMDLISGYGEFKKLDMEGAKVKLRDLKGQAQQVSKIQDISTGQEPQKTGIERRSPSMDEKRLIREVNEARERFGVGTLKAYKARLENQIADLEIRIKRGDFGKKTKNLMDISRDAEAVRLLAEKTRWEKKFRDARYEARKATETKMGKAIRYGKELLNLPRAIKSSIDLSAVLRQGGFIALGNPARAIRNIGPMFKAAVSPKAFEQSEASIRSRPNAPLYKSSKLYLADMDGDLTNREEAFRSEWSDRIPGVKGSNRAYIAFLNRMRADSFDAIIGSLTTDPTPAQLKAIAHYINVATGRGDLGVHGSAAETLSTVLWSPRLLISRIQILVAEPLLRGDAKGVRTVIAKEYAKALSGVAVILALGALMGADIERDPRSSDFGKMKVGYSRIDPWMGLQQITVLGTRVGSTILNTISPGTTSGDVKTQKGKIKSLRPQKKKSPTDQDVFDISMRFLRTKFTPILGGFFDVITGESVVGEKVTPASGGIESITPLSLSDLFPILEAHGIPRGGALFLLNLFGMSVQHQDDKKR